MTALLGAGLMGIVVLRADPVYASSVTFFAVTPNSDGSALQGDQFGQQRVNSYVKLLDSQRLAQEVLDNDPDLVDSGLNPARLQRKISGRADLNTVLFTATINDSDPDRALQITRGIADVFPRLVNSIESRTGKQKAPVYLDVVSGPELNPYPVSPHKKIDVGLGLVGGAVLGVFGALGLTILDRTVRTTQVLGEVTGLPVLAALPEDSSAKRAPLLIANPQSTRAEAFRGLRTNLSFVGVEGELKVLLVSSAVPNEGKSSTATNLALTFAGADKRVLLIEADLRRPKVAGYLGLEGAAGLTNVLASQVECEDVIQVVDRGRLAVLTAGSTPPNPSELLGSRAMADLIERLKKSYDLIVIDTPPLLPVTDAVVLSGLSDGVVFVVRYGKTSRADVVRAVDALRVVEAPIAGAVLNRTPSRGVDAYRYSTYDYGSDGGR
ncbi:MAG: polysaccharide biosynthesis tyrosine autokinase [Nocardioidaceae bacterium]